MPFKRGDLIRRTRGARYILSDEENGKEDAEDTYLNEDTIYEVLGDSTCYIPALNKYVYGISFYFVKSANEDK